MKSNFGKSIVVILALLGLIGLLPLQSQADLMFYSNRADMPKNDSVDWGSLVYNTATSNHGVQVTVPNYVYTYSQGYWLGNFAPGDNLVVGSGHLVMEFNRPLSSVGAQIQFVILNSSFAGTLEAFDAGHNFLGSFSMTVEPYTAQFMGVADPQGRIASIDFAVSNYDTGFIDSNLFAINKLDCSVDSAGNGVSVSPAPLDPVSPAPLPGALLLCGSGLLGLAGWRYKKS